MICYPCRSVGTHDQCIGHADCYCLHRVGQQIVAKPMKPMPKGIKYA